jgi:flavoprotein
MPSDYKEGLTVTKLPDGRDFRLRIRREDAENVKTLAKIDGVSILKKPDEIDPVFKKHFNPP